MHMANSWQLWMPITHLFQSSRTTCSHACGEAGTEQTGEAKEERRATGEAREERSTRARQAGAHTCSTASKRAPRRVSGGHAPRVMTAHRSRRCRPEQQQQNTQRSLEMIKASTQLTRSLGALTSALLRDEGNCGSVQHCLTPETPESDVRWIQLT